METYQFSHFSWNHEAPSRDVERGRRWEESNTDEGSKREGAPSDIFFDKTDDNELFNRGNQDRVAIANHRTAEWAAFFRRDFVWRSEFSHSVPLLFGHLYFLRAPNDCRLATTNSTLTLVN